MVGTIRALFGSVLVLALSGCQDDTVRVHIATDNPELAVEVVQGAEEILGIGIEPATLDDPKGSIIVFFVKPAVGAKHLGTSSAVSRCSRALWSDYDPHVFAHELAHALGVYDHACEIDGSGPECAPEHKDRLMYPRAGGTDLTDAERDTMSDHIRMLDRC